MGRTMFSLRLKKGADHVDARSQIERSALVADALGHGLLAIDYSVDADDPDRATLMLTMLDADAARRLASREESMRDMALVEVADRPRVMVDPRKR